MIRLVISQTAISKSIWGNLNRRLKNRGMRIPPSFRRDEDGTAPKEAFELFLGSVIVGFMVRQVEVRGCRPHEQAESAVDCQQGELKERPRRIRLPLTSADVTMHAADTPGASVLSGADLEALPCRDSAKVGIKLPIAAAFLSHLSHLVACLRAFLSSILALDPSAHHQVYQSKLGPALIVHTASDLFSPRVIVSSCS